MWELDNIKGWEPKNVCLPTVVLEKTLEGLLDRREIKAVNSKGNQSWTFIGGTDAKADAPVLWLPGVKNQITGKDPDAGKDRRQEEKGTREWDGWTASPTQWTWVWANTRKWWRTGKPGVLQSMGSLKVRHNQVTVQQQWNGENLI